LEAVLRLAKEGNVRPFRQCDHLYTRFSHLSLFMQQKVRVGFLHNTERDSSEVPLERREHEFLVARALHAALTSGLPCPLEFCWLFSI
jgi:hypothetical protein